MFFSLPASWSWEEILTRNSSKLESKWDSPFLSCNQSCFTSFSLKKRDHKGFIRREHFSGCNECSHHLRGMGITSQNTKLIKNKGYFAVTDFQIMRWVRNGGNNIYSKKCIVSLVIMKAFLDDCQSILSCFQAVGWKEALMSTLLNGKDHWCIFLNILTIRPDSLPLLPHAFFALDIIVID